MEVINQILVLFIIILIGYISKRKGLINEKINKGLSNLLIEIILPALIIDSLISIELTTKLLHNLKLMGIISILSYLTVIVIANLFSRYLSLTADRNSVFIILLVFGNVGYMGLPVINALYPEQGLVIAIIHNVVFNIFVWTYGYYIFARTENESSKFKASNLLNNGIIAVILGFIILFTGIELGPAAGAVETLGHMTFPLSMLIIGSSLTGIKFTKMLKDKILYLIIALKLLLIPLLAVFIIKSFNLPDIISNISILLLAMPSGAIGVVFAEKYNSDYQFASEGVIFTTLLSIITIPLMLYLIL